MKGKSSIFIVFIAIFITSCGGGSGDGAVANNENNGDTTAGQQPNTENLPTYGNIWQPSPYDHSNIEVLSGEAPIIYERIFERERELNGYNPRFIPGRTYFDRLNLPWIVVHNQNQLDVSDPDNPVSVDPITGQPTNAALHSITYDDRYYSSFQSENNRCVLCDTYIQRLDESGSWLYTSLNRLASDFGFDAEAYSSDSRTRTKEGEQIYFRTNGDVFVKMRHGVLVYQENTGQWSGYKRRGVGWVTNMTGDGNEPPTFIGSRGSSNRISVVRLQDSADGGYQWNESTITPDSFPRVDHASSFAIVRGSTIHMAAMAQNESAYGREESNTAQLYLRIDMDTGEHQTLFMGWSGNNGYSSYDNHNNPVLLVDEQNYLHFFSGAHSHHIWHRRSKTPIDTAAWIGSIPDSSTVDDLFTPGPQSSAAGMFNQTELQDGVDYIAGQSGLTYPQVKMTTDGIIHIAVRDNPVSSGDPIRLVYIRGNPMGNGDYQWSTPESLVIPNWASYSNYKHKMHVDRLNGVYLTYTYEIQNMLEGEWFDASSRARGFSSKAECEATSSTAQCLNPIDEHYNRWPGEPLENSWNLGQAFAHDPVLLSSDNSGNTWELTTTQKFMEGVQVANESNVVAE